MQVKINDVSIEDVKKGKSSYQVATVSYTHDGVAKERKIMSFANPNVFKAVQENVGNDVEIKIVKEGNFFNWDDVSTVKTASGNKEVPVTKVVGSNYETKEERAARQVLIVKQSSLSSAIELYHHTSPASNSPDEAKKIVLDLAQDFTDWVFNNV